MLRSDAYQVIQIVYEYVSPISHYNIFYFTAAASLFNECAYHRTVYEVQKKWANNASTKKLQFYVRAYFWHRNLFRDVETGLRELKNLGSVEDGEGEI